jgi:hypothetical protein
VTRFTKPGPPIAIAAPLFLVAATFAELQDDLERLEDRHRNEAKGRDGWWDQLYADTQTMLNAKTSASSSPSRTR